MFLGIGAGLRVGFGFWQFLFVLDTHSGHVVRADNLCTYVL